ncbi:protein-disulfide reductase DsbD [Neptunicella marina]|uniref:protein-disulfide reductase DsbD n=1 Tax=Neptunicella marina TaxID=2125989 RepID=UPI001886DE4C
MLRVLFLFAVLLTQPAWSQVSSPIDSLLSDEPQFLPVDQAFAFDFKQNGQKLVLSFDIAEGYYLYKKQFKYVIKDAELSEPSYPKGDDHEDEFFGKSEVFRGNLPISFEVINAVKDAVVKIRYQGCAEAGLCYPPTTKVIYLTAVRFNEGITSGKDKKQMSLADIAKNKQHSSATQDKNTEQPDTEQTTTAQAAPQQQSQQFDLAEQLTSKDNLALTLLLFVGLGILLAFTPCVFPMYPILSALVLGQNKNSGLAKTFTLSFVYVQGMALTYSLLGLVVASAGVQFQAALQHPAILWVLIAIFVLLALVMFGAWELQLPSKWQEKLNAFSNKQTAGSLAGVFVMGAISGLVASPCTTAPLTGILLFVAQSGDLTLGFAALYMLSLGMGIPLILFALTSGKLLPKAGNWMNIVKATFGFMMLAVALLFVERMFDNLFTTLAWSLLGLALFSYWSMHNNASASSPLKFVRTVVIFIGLFGSAMYGYQTLFGSSQPVHSAVSGEEAPELAFVRVKNLEDFEQKLAEANAQGKSVMIDLYADWCVACKEFEKYTFPDIEVRKALRNTVVMQIDLTDNTPTNLGFQEHFAILGLPTILLFDSQGKELTQARITGFMKPAAFSAHLNHHLK